ncbi:unnamed protein product [Staurois parvus]|uniref:Uncharacterized protein n=1 Tax=Staurois parvus TaxID=386267 RepID=A0ABN9C2W2_9NEOB|nr:unnamed protein product [Staurois parvus]
MGPPPKVTPVTVRTFDLQKRFTLMMEEVSTTSWQYSSQDS